METVQPYAQPLSLGSFTFGHVLFYLLHFQTISETVSSFLFVHLHATRATVSSILFAVLAHNESNSFLLR
jgi:hypothetical protein